MKLPLKDVLIYAAVNRKAEVTQFSYPMGKLVGEFSANYLGLSLCSDKSGDVWIPSGKEMLEYAHGGSAPIATLQLPQGGFEQDCAVSPTSGDLAVAYNGDLVAVYRRATGAPKTYTASSFQFMVGITYDSAGDLIAYGYKAHGILLAELPYRGGSFSDLQLHLRAQVATFTRWDGTYVAAGSLSDTKLAEKVFRIKIAGSQAKVVGTVLLRSPERFGPFAALSNGALLQTDSSGNAVFFFHYPAGGSPFKKLSDLTREAKFGGIAFSFPPTI